VPLLRGPSRSRASSTAPTGGMTFNQVLGRGNMVVSDRVKLQLDIAVKQV
jgi:hypothetical protein